MNEDKLIKYVNPKYNIDTMISYEDFLDIVKNEEIVIVNNYGDQDDTNERYL